MKIADPILAALGAALLLVGRGAAQVPPLAADAGVLLVDGTFLRGRPVGLDRAGGVLRWHRPGDGDEIAALPLADVVAVAGAAAARRPRPSELVRLVGGEELRGAIVGGDLAGETLTIRSPSLGDRVVRVDRVASIAFLERIGDERREDFAVPEDVDEDEVLFLPARRGFDLVVGFVHRFTDDGVLFEARGDVEPRLRPYPTLAGFALRGGEPRAAPAGALLTTVTGDRVGAEWLDCGPAAFRFRLEGGAEVELPQAEVASLTPHREGRTFLSDLPVIEARERSYFDDGDLPLLPYRLDRAVDGGALRASGLGFGKGVGVHARSALAWRVPPDARALVGLVAVDDSALELPVRGVVTVTVRQDDDVLFRVEQLAAGEPPRSLGALPVRPGATLRLEVDFGPGLDLGDRVDWLAVAFLR